MLRINIITLIVLFFKCFKRITYHLWKRYNLA